MSPFLGCVLWWRRKHLCVCNALFIGTSHHPLLGVHLYTYISTNISNNFIPSPFLVTVTPTQHIITFVCFLAPSSADIICTCPLSGGAFHKIVRFGGVICLVQGRYKFFKNSYLPSTRQMTLPKRTILWNAPQSSPASQTIDHREDRLYGQVGYMVSSHAFSTEALCNYNALIWDLLAYVFSFHWTKLWTV